MIGGCCKAQGLAESCQVGGVTGAQPRGTGAWQELLHCCRWPRQLGLAVSCWQFMRVWGRQVAHHDGRFVHIGACDCAHSDHPIRCCAGLAAVVQGLGEPADYILRHLHATSTRLTPEQGLVAAVLLNQGIQATLCYLPLGGDRWLTPRAAH